MSIEKKLPAFCGHTVLSRRSFLYGAGALAATGSMDSAVASHFYPSMGSEMKEIQPVPSGEVHDAAIAVLPGILGVIPPYFCGLSFEKNIMCNMTLSGESPNFIALCKLLGPGVIRIGGNAVDQIGSIWNPHGAGGAKDEIALPDMERLAAFVKATGWKIIYGINLATNTPARAASEAYHAVALFGKSLVGLEIGNEPDFFHLWPALGPAASWKADEWLRNFEDAVKAIHDVVPHAPIVGPALGMHMEWLDAMIAVKIPDLALYTAHYYIVGPRVPGHIMEPMLRYPDPGLLDFTSTMRAKTGKTGVPYRIGECNSFAGGGATGVSNSCASSLWAIEMMMGSAIGGACGLNFHVNYSSRGYSPIPFNATDASGVQPEYYGMLMASMAGTGQLKSTTISDHKLNCSAFAIKDGENRLKVIVTNKESEKSLRVTLDAGFKANHAIATCMENPSLTALAGTTIQRATVAPSGEFSPKRAYTLTVTEGRVNCYVPSMGAIVISIT